MVARVVYRKGKFVSPLATDHSKKGIVNTFQQNQKVKSRHASSTRHGQQQQQQQHQQQQQQQLRISSTLYVCENFTLQLPNVLNLNLSQLVNGNATTGFVTTKFSAHKAMSSMALTAGGYRLFSVPNAGGSSIVSEVLSFEVLGRCFGAKLVKTEMEVTYFPHGGSITDYVCDVSQATVGVSVTRAWKYQGEYDLDDATHLLNKKLKGVLQSTKNSLVKWTKQILHVWSASDFVTRILRQAYDNLDIEVKANTVVLVTTASEADYIFRNGYA